MSANPAPRSPSSTIPPGFVVAHVRERRALTPQVTTFRLSLDDARTAESAAAGSHIEVLLDLGSGEEVRHYSICAASESDITIAVLREADGRGGSRHLHDEVQPGTKLLVRGPRNTFPYRATGPALFVAGGIGITPFLTMIAEAEAAGVDWQLLYLGRDRNLMAYASELARHGDRVTFWDSATRGRADVTARIAALPQHTTVYACGPEPLQHALREAATATGHAIVIEDFDSGKAEAPAAQENEAPAGTPGGAVSADGRPSLPFTVELADGSEIDVAADQSILDALNQAGFRALSSCKRGTCGTCETPILEGTADHRDSVLSEEERAAGETMMICVSRACGSRITLDL